MYTKPQITILLKKVVDAFIKARPDYGRKWDEYLTGKKNNCKLPDYYDTYAFQVELAERIRIHAELECFPEKLFKERSPNQTEMELNYIKANYKAVTLPFFIDYVSTVSRSFLDPNCGVVYGKEVEAFKSAGIGFEKYVTEEIRDYGSIDNFTQFILPSIKAMDANGLVVVKPINTPTDEAYTEEVIQEEGEQTKLETPVPVYFPIKQVVGFEEGEYAIVELEERSKVLYGSTEQKMGLIYEFYDNMNIWRITQTGKYVDFNFKFEVYYAHNWKRLPFMKLKGIPRIYRGKIIWLAPMNYVTDILDLVTLNSSNLQLSINNCVYPYRVMYGDPCNFQSKDGDGNINLCDGGYMVDGLGARTGSVCSICHGTGLKNRISPLGVLLMRPPSRDDKGDGEMKQKPMEYISPSTETLEFLRSKIKEDYSKAENILHLKYNTNQVNPGGAADAGKESATQSASGQKALYAFVKSVSDQTLEIKQFILDAIGWQRYKENYDRAIVKKAIAFDFQNEMEYIQQISTATAAKVPPFMLYSIIYKYLRAVWQDDKDTGAAFNLITTSDRLLTLSTDEIQTKLLGKTAEKWEDILHTSAPFLVIKLQNAFKPVCNPDKADCMLGFFDQDIAEQQDQLVKLAKELASEIDKNDPQKKTQQELIKTIAEGGAPAPAEPPVVVN